MRTLHLCQTIPQNLEQERRLLAHHNHELLMHYSSGQHGNELLASCLAGQWAGLGCLPTYLGLCPSHFSRMIQTHFSTISTSTMRSISTQQSQLQGQLRQELLDLRQDEWQELQQLLSSLSNTDHPVSFWMTHIVAAGCLGTGHLWRGLALHSRQELGTLLHTCFPILAERNVHNMRWKKFIYKQLCEQQGSYLCRSPDCRQCPTYQSCFDDEQQSTISHLEPGLQI